MYDVFKGDLDIISELKDLNTNKVKVVGKFTIKE